MPQANPIRKKMLAKKAAYKKAVIAKANQKNKLSNIKKPVARPKHRGNKDAKGNTTNLKTKKK